MIVSKFDTNLTVRSTPGSVDLERHLSSGSLLCLSPYSHTESLLQRALQSPRARKSGPTDTKWENMYVGKLDHNEEHKKKQQPEHRDLQTTEW